MPALDAARTDIARKPRILIVEDVMLIAMDFSEQVTELGYEVVGPAARLEQGLDLVARDTRIDGALLDINLAGELCYPIAARLRQRGVPFVFVTAERVLGIPREFQDVFLLVKPVARIQIRDVLRSFEETVPTQ